MISFDAMGFFKRTQLKKKIRFLVGWTHLFELGFNIGIVARQWQRCLRGYALHSSGSLIKNLCFNEQTFIVSCTYSRATSANEVFR